MLRYVNGVLRLGLTRGGEVPFEHPGKSTPSVFLPAWATLARADTRVQGDSLSTNGTIAPLTQKIPWGRRTADGLLGASFTHCRQENGVTKGDFVIATHSFTNRRTMRSRIGTPNALAASRNCTRKSARRPFDCQSRLVSRERPAHACNARMRRRRSSSDTHSAWSAIVRVSIPSLPRIVVRHRGRHPKRLEQPGNASIYGLGRMQIGNDSD